MEKIAQKEAKLTLVRKAIVQILICSSLLLCIPLVSQGTDDGEQNAPETVFKLFYSANVLGELEACG